MANYIWEQNSRTILSNTQVGRLIDIGAHFIDTIRFAMILGWLGRLTKAIHKGARNRKYLEVNLSYLHPSKYSRIEMERNELKSQLIASYKERRRLERHLDIANSVLPIVIRRVNRLEGDIAESNKDFQEG